MPYEKVSETTDGDGFANAPPWLQWGLCMFQSNNSPDTGKTGKTDFVHESVRYNDGASRSKLIILSTCARCGSYIGASGDTELLARVESLHQCSATKTPLAGAA